PHGAMSRLVVALRVSSSSSKAMETNRNYRLHSNPTSALMPPRPNFRRNPGNEPIPLFHFAAPFQRTAADDTKSGIEAGTQSRTDANTIRRWGGKSHDHLFRRSG